MQFNQDYVQNPAFSQSDINMFEKDIVKFYNTKILGLGQEETSDPMEIGSIIDAILLNPEELKKYYVVTDLKAKGKVKDVVDIVWQRVCNEIQGELPEKLEELTDFIMAAMTAVEYQTNWKAETRLAKIISEGSGYFDQLKEAHGLYMVSLENWNTAHSTVESIGSDPYTADILRTLKNGPQEDHIQVIKQMPLFGQFEGIAMKGQVDFMIVDTQAKQIIPWDLKTAANHARFRQNYRKSRYGRQGAYYTELIKQNYPGYEVADFMFLVVPVERPKDLAEEASFEHPEVYLMTKSELALHTQGYSHPSGYRIKGWQELLKEIQWHVENSKFEHRKEYYECGVNILETINDPTIATNEEEITLY